MSFSTARYRRLFRRSWALAGVCCGAWLLLLVSAAAQRVTASVSPATVSKGQSAEYVIKYEGPQAQVEAVPDPVVDGLEFAGPNHGREFRFDSRGGSVYTESFTWRVLSHTPGRYVIPPQEIVFNGQTFTAEAVTLEVTESAPPPPSLEPILELEVGKQELYVGEVVSVTITAFFHRHALYNQLDHPKLPRDNFVVKRFPPPGPAPTVRRNGQPYVPVRFISSLSAVKEGQLQLGPATLQCDVVFPEDGAVDDTTLPRGFPRSFFRNTSVRRMELKSEPIMLNVKPLPAEGRPENFSGAVGRFSFNAQLSQRGNQWRVGEPIAVDLVVMGVGNFDSLSAPVLTSSEGWKLYPAKVTQENRSTGLENGVQIFNQVLVPQRVMTEVPPFELSYFDPAVEKYVTVRSDAILVTIQEDTSRPEAAPAATVEASNVSGVKDFTFAEAATPEEKLSDILTVRPAGRPFLSLAGGGAVRSSFWVMHTVPALCLLGLVVWGARRRWTELTVQKALARDGQPRELAAIRRDMRRPGLARREFYSYACEYLNAWEKRTHRAAPREDAALKRLLERHAFYKYSGENHDAAEATPPDEVNEVMAVLERLLKA